MQLKIMTSKFFRLVSAGSNIFRLLLNYNSARLRFKRFSAELLRLWLWRPGLNIIGPMALPCTRPLTKAAGSERHVPTLV